jgi:hypothetical protein
MSGYAVLVAKLRNELSKVEMAVRSAVSQAEKARLSGDEDFWCAAAFSLQNFYMGTERIFEEVAKLVDRSLPSGGSSHRALLEQMALEIPNVRPAVILVDTLDRLQEYRGFRHVAIHLYAFELHSDRISVLVDMLMDSWVLLCRDVEVFCCFLLALEQNV